MIWFRAQQSHYRSYLEPFTVQALLTMVACELSLVSNLISGSEKSAKWIAGHFRAAIDRVGQFLPGYTFRIASIRELTCNLL